jgi:hypothetical protein
MTERLPLKSHEQQVSDVPKGHAELVAETESEGKEHAFANFDLGVVARVRKPKLIVKELSTKHSPRHVIEVLDEVHDQLMHWVDEYALQIAALKETKESGDAQTQTD